MRILLICAGGVSSTLMMKKIEKAAESVGDEVYINATSLNSYQADADRYDVIVLAPQVRYKEAEVKDAVKKPVVALSSEDYSAGDGVKIYQQIKASKK